MEYGKKFIVLGNMNAVKYKEVFPFIKEDKIWVGVSPRSMEFILPNGEKGVVNACWFTNLEHNKRHRPLDLYKHYSNEYKHYDNYDAIEVGKVCEIPMDYDGVMGVPITFLDKYCPEQFEIVDINPHFFSLIEQGIEKPKQLSLKSHNMKDPYARILIRHRK